MMIKLINSSTDLMRQIKDRDGLKAEYQKAQGYLSIVNKSTDKIKHDLKIYQQLISNDISNDLDSTEELLEQIKSNSDNLLSKITTMSISDEELMDWKQAIRDFDTELNIIWKEFIKHEVISNIRLNDIITRIFKSQNPKLIRVNDSEWPITAKRIDELKKFNESVKKSIERLELTPSIENFLFKALDGKATLADMDQELFKWLEVNNLLKQFKISI